jgi:phage-related baseplate assembly protein
MIALQQPTLIEELDLEELFKQRQKGLIDAYKNLSADKNAPAAVNIQEAIAQPSDPLHQLLRVEAYRELMLRQRINETMRGHLLAFATGTSLDQLGQNYGMVRHTNEQDDDFRERIRDNFQGTHTAGTKAYYISLAAAHPFVQDVNVEKGRAGEVVVSVKPLSPNRLLAFIATDQEDKSVKGLLTALANQKDKAQVLADRTQFDALYQQLAQEQPQLYSASDSLPWVQAQTEHAFSKTAAAAALMLPIVAAMMNQDDKKMLTDRIRVVEATAIPVRIRIKVYFKAGVALDTQHKTQKSLQQQFRKTFEQAANLGWQVAPSWIYNALVHADVAYIELLEPSTVVTIPFNGYAQLWETGLEIED